MKIASLLLGGVLCAGILSPGFCPEARADGGRAEMSSPATAEAGPSAAPRAGTGAESLDYARREESSPEVQDFEGGDGIFIGGGVLFLVLLVILVILLLDD